MSTAVPTLHRMATYGAAGTAANSRTKTAARGKIANLTSPLPIITPTAAAALRVTASHATVHGGSRAAVAFGRIPQ